MVSPRVYCFLVCIGLTGCQADPNQTETDVQARHGLPASQQLQSAPSAGVKFNQSSPFTPLLDDKETSE